MNQQEETLLREAKAATESGQAANHVSGKYPFEKEETGYSRLKAGGLVILILAALAFPQVFTLPYYQNVAILILMNALMAVAWNIIGGYTGQVALGNTIFFGFGAYSSAILLSRFLISPWVGLLMGIVASIAVAMVFGYPCFRLKGHYFGIATLAIGEIISTLVLNTQQLGGADGINLPVLPESLINIEFRGFHKAPYYYIILTFLAIALLTVYKVERSKWGYYFRAIKADQDGARALGINPAKYKMVAFVLSAIFTSMAGTFYAQYVMYIDPGSVFYLQISIGMCLMVVLGGLGTLWGPVIGAAVLIALQEATRVAFGGTGQGVDLMLYGFLVVVVVLFQPRGLMGLLDRLGWGK